MPFKFNLLAYAANLIGLSEQIPICIVFLTNGASKEIKIGNQSILFKTTTEKYVLLEQKNGACYSSSENIGKDNIDPIRQTKSDNFLLIQVNMSILSI